MRFREITFAAGDVFRFSRWCKGKIRKWNEYIHITRLKTSIWRRQSFKITAPARIICEKSGRDVLITLSHSASRSRSDWNARHAASPDKVRRADGTVGCRHAKTIFTLKQPRHYQRNAFCLQKSRLSYLSSRQYLFPFPFSCTQYFKNFYLN